MLINLVPMAIALASLFLSGLILVSWKKRSKHFNGRSPLSRDLLRSPGETLRDKIEDLNFDIAGYFALTPLIPLFLYSAYLTAENQHPNSSVVRASIYTIIATIGVAFWLKKLMALFKRRHKLSIGLDAELAVAQELNELMLNGHRVFHDFPADNFNIDHIVVGESGVYAVETKGRSKPPQKNGQATWEVNYDGNTLQFPGWSETKPLEQAKNQASWLQEWLSSAVGEHIAVKPVLILPGWYVKRTSPRGIWVSNGKNMQSLLSHPEGSPLPQKVVQQISHQLDQRCRNVKPTGTNVERKT